MEVSDQIIKVMDDLTKKFGVAVDWTQDNIPPYIEDLCHRIVMYDIAKNSIWIAISLIVILAGLVFITLERKSSINNEKRTLLFGYNGSVRRDYDNWGCVLFFTLYPIVSSIFVIVILKCTFSIVQDIYLPEKEIIEMLKQLM